MKEFLEHYTEGPEHNELNSDGGGGEGGDGGGVSDNELKGLELALEANRQFDIWKRVERAAIISEDSSPEGISLNGAQARFEDAVVAAAELIVHRMSKAARWQIGFALSDGPRSPSEATKP